MAITKLSFKEYLISKQKLREAVLNAPHYTSSYNIKKYCKMVVGESMEDREDISLKPKQSIIVEWLYDNMASPTILNVRFEGVENIDPDEEFETVWTGERLLKWLTRNTTERK